MSTGKNRQPALPSRRSRLVLCGAVVVGVLWPGLIGSAAPNDNSGTCADDTEMQFLSMINDYRTSNGLGELELSQTLSEAADFHSADMGQRGYFDHTMPDGTTVEMNLLNFGYNDGTYGENILAGTESASSALQTWENSPGHNANMLRGSFNAIGIGRVYSENSPYGWYWTTLFGGEVDEPGNICGQPPANRDNQNRRDLAQTNDDVNVRRGPSLQADILQAIPAGVELDVTGTEQDGYLPVLFNGQDTWVAAQYVDLPVSTDETMSPAAAPAAVTTTETVNLRGAPDRQSEVLTIIPGDSPVELTGASQDGYDAAIVDGLTGWIDRAYLAYPSGNAGQSAPVRAPMDEYPNAGEWTGATMAYATEEVNVRSEPDRAGGVLTVIPGGTEVQLTGEHADGYFGAIVDGIQGWIDAAYLQ